MNTIKERKVLDEVSVLSSKNLGFYGLNAFHTERLDSEAVRNIMHVDVVAVRMNTHF